MASLVDEWRSEGTKDMVDGKCDPSLLEGKGTEVTEVLRIEVVGLDAE